MSDNVEENTGLEQTSKLQGIWKWVCIALSLIGMFIVVNQLFYLKLMGIMLYDNQYLYILMAIFLGAVFLYYPLRVYNKRYLLLDVSLFLLTLSICSYFSYKGYEIDKTGWGYIAPKHALVMAIILWCLIIEAVRRTAGRMMAIIIIVFSFYPMFAQYMPSLLSGPPKKFTATMLFHILSLDSALGIPIRVFATQLIGFMLFGAALQAVGGGQWFLNLAYSILGTARGGPGKVAILGSALFGSLSGSPISNVITTGTITIPAMKKNGFAPHTAGAIEACASTGGVLMPPVMGAVAFVMAAFIGMSYSSLVIAAAIPSILYYFGLMVQVDGYAVKKQIIGLNKDEIPSFLQTIKDGWVYLLSMFVLIYCLFVMRQVGAAPFYALFALLVISMFDKKTRLTFTRFLDFFEGSGKFLAELIAIMVGIGMVMGALTITGVASSLSRELVMLAGGNVAFMLILGAIASFFLGMGMSATACYIFLAIVLAPALITVGFNPLATHLFLLYYGMLSYITPPVAMAAYPAATIARSSALKVGLEATRLGGVIYIIPFFFVLEPALVLQGSVGEILFAFSCAVIGVFLISSALSNYLLTIGELKYGKINGIVRGFLFISGVLIGLPFWQTKLTALAMLIITVVLMLFSKYYRRPAMANVTRS